MAADTATAAGRRRRTTKDPRERRKENGVGGKYRVGGRGMEESADESSEWRGEETEESALEEEAETGGRAGETGRPLTATAGG